MKIKYKNHIIVLFVFLALTILALRSILFQPGVIGQTWDWSIPIFPKQFVIRAIENLSAWNATSFGGTFIQLKTEYPYWLMTTLFSMFGGGIVVKLSIFIIILLCLFSMFIFSKKVFKMSLFWSGVAASIYTFSPFFYSRLVAGHLPFLIVYALLPLLSYILFQLSSFKSLSKLKKNLKLLLFLILMVPFLTSVHHMAVLVFLISFCIFIYSIITSKNKKYIFVLYLLLSLIFILGSAHLSFPLFSSIISKNKLALKTFEDVSTVENLNQRWDYMENVSQPLTKVISLAIPNNLYTEFVYPISSEFSPFYIIFVLGLLVLSLASLIFYKENKKIILFVLILVLGILLSSGLKTIFGKFFFRLMFKLLPPIFAGFVNALRFLPLVFLSLSVLSAYTLNKLSQKLSAQNKKILKISVFFPFLLLFYPWLFRSLTKPVYEQGSQPFSLQVNQVHPEEKKVFDYFNKMPDDFRVSFLPPYNVSWPGKSEFYYAWNFGYWAKPTFLEHLHQPLAKSIIQKLYTHNDFTSLGRLLALANVKMLIFPRYESFGSNYNFIPGETNYKKVIDVNLDQQEKIELIESGFETVDVYENKDNLPHIYIASQAVYSSGNGETLAEIVALPEYKLDSAIFLKQADMISSDSEFIYQFNPLFNEGYQNYLLKDGQWVELTNIKTDKDTRTAIIDRLDFNNSLNLNCQPKEDNPGLVECDIQNYPSSTSLELVISYTYTQGKAGFAIVENNNNQVLAKQLLDKTKTGEIKTGSFEFNSSSLSNLAKLYLIVEPDGRIEPNLEIKEISLNNINPATVVMQSTVAELDKPAISFKKVNSSKYELSIKGANKPYYLVFSESYHSEWDLYQNGKKLLLDTHKQVNGFANSWYISPADVGNKTDYKLSLEFAPQKTYLTGLIITLTVWTFTGISLLLIFLKKYLKNKVEK